MVTYFDGFGFLNIKGHATIISWKYSNTRNTISLSVSKISFIFLIIPIDYDSTNYQNIWVGLSMATFTH